MQIKNWNVVRESSVRVGLVIVKVKIVPFVEAMKILSGCLPFSDYQAQNRFLPRTTLAFFYQLSGGNSRKTSEPLK
jgi:hypothetical protein